MQMISNPGYDGPRPQLDVQTARLYSPVSEWTYSHHASITRFRGRYHAIWSNGHVDEDAPGQRVLIASSDDFVAWSEPRPLVEAWQGVHAPVVLTASGFHQHGGTLVAYAGVYDYPTTCFEGKRLASQQEHVGTGLYALTTQDGESWSAPRNLDLPCVPNHPPQPTASGRLIISGNISFPYTDDPTGLSGWTMTGIYSPEIADGLFDDPRGHWIVRQAMGWAPSLCEGSWLQTADGVLHMLLRATGPGHAGHLWLTESRDDGATWSPPQPTPFSDNNTKFHLGRWPDGRFYYVGCPDPEPRGARRPLVLSLSNDGLVFDQHYTLCDQEYVQRREGQAKGGLFGYPHTLIDEGHLHVIVSLRKEAVMVLRMRCDQVR